MSHIWDDKHKEVLTYLFFLAGLMFSLDFNGKQTLFVLMWFCSGRKLQQACRVRQTQQFLLMIMRRMFWLMAQLSLPLSDSSHLYIAFFATPTSILFINKGGIVGFYDADPWGGFFFFYHACNKSMQQISKYFCDGKDKGLIKPHLCVLRLGHA